MRRMITSIALVVSVTSVNAALIARDLDGESTTAEAYYDTVLNITWLANALNTNEPAIALSPSSIY